MKIKQLTDIGNAERFMDQHREVLRYCPELRQWFCWTGTRWAKDLNDDVTVKGMATVKAIERESEAARNNGISKEEFMKHAERSQNLSKIKAMIRLAQAFPDLQVSVSEFDGDPMLLNCDNGTLDLRTGELMAHVRGHLITKSTGIAYDRDMECPLWQAFLYKIMGGNESAIRYLQRVVGYSLTGSMKEQCLFIFNGYGANGKSTFLETIRKILGDYAMHTPSSTLLTNSTTIRNDLARFRGARFVSAVEIGIGKKLNETLIKELTGGDPITARFLFREFFEQRPSFKLFVATNYKPEIQGTDHGIWRRIRLIPFDVVLAEKEIDRELSHKLGIELPGILAWAVQGCLDWQHEGLPVPEIVKTATLEYREESDVVSRFIEDCCDFGRGREVSIKALYDLYRVWSEENADELVTKKTFGHFLKQRGHKQRKSGGIRYWVGLAPQDRDDSLHGSPEPRPDIKEVVRH